MAKKPSNLIYGVDDRPSLAVAGLLGVQHVFVMSAGWVMVVVIATAVGASHDQVTDVVRMSMIASGVATILQSLANSRFGSGYLCPVSVGPAYISASILAGKAGGLPLMFTLTFMSGCFEAALSRILPRLRQLFPPEVTGLVVTMVGLELVALGSRKFLGFEEGRRGLDPSIPLVAMISLAGMIIPTVWGRGRIRLYPLLIGLAAGYASAYVLGAFDQEQIKELRNAALIGIPRRADVGWAFDAALLPAFLIAGLASTLKTVGDLTLCQKINDADWKRTDMRSVSGGVVAGAVGTTLSGLLGGIGQSTFSSNVGLSLATGATSRFIAIPCGILLIAVAFLPKLAALVAIMPGPVMGAILVYVACYMILAGIQVITSRMLDSRRTFVVGIPLIFGLSVDVVPGLYRDVPGAIAPLFGSSLALSTVLVLLLNMVFRIGITKVQRLRWAPGVDSAQTVFDFMETRGATWGARRDVVQRATAALNELLETVTANGLASGQVDVAVTFDEFNLDVEVRYDGKLMPFPPVRPTEAALIEDDGALASLSGFLIRQYTDRLSSGDVDGHCRVELHFIH